MPPDKITFMTFSRSLNAGVKKSKVACRTAAVGFQSKIENPRAVLFRNGTLGAPLVLHLLQVCTNRVTATALQNIAPQGQKCRMENAQFAKHFKLSLDNLLLVRLLMWAPFKGF